MGKGLTQGHLGVYLGYSALQVGFLPIQIGPTPITSVEMPGIEHGASYMQSMRSTTELHPPYTTRRTRKISEQLDTILLVDSAHGR